MPSSFDESDYYEILAHHERVAGSRALGQRTFLDLEDLEDTFFSMTHWLMTSREGKSGRKKKPEGYMAGIRHVSSQGMRARCASGRASPDDGGRLAQSYEPQMAEVERVLQALNDMDVAAGTGVRSRAGSPISVSQRRGLPTAAHFNAEGNCLEYAANQHATGLIAGQSLVRNALASKLSDVRRGRGAPGTAGCEDTSGRVRQALAAAYKDAQHPNAGGESVRYAHSPISPAIKALRVKNQDVFGAINDLDHSLQKHFRKWEQHR